MATPLPKTSAPAQRALDGINVDSLEKLAAWRQADIASLHGMGPKALGILRAALEDAKLAFRNN